ncbi:MAG: hypothetical protein R2830_06795 [Saprospiraceae bacterium]
MVRPDGLTTSAVVYVGRAPRAGLCAGGPGGGDVYLAGGGPGTAGAGGKGDCFKKIGGKRFYQTM